MVKRAYFAATLILMMSTLILSGFPVTAWNDTETGLEDTKYEKFGPRCDRLLIRLYENAEAEWDALEAGEIDITDWPLTEPYYDRFTTPPQNESIETKFYGAEFGLFLLDINWNNNPFLGNPQDPSYPNPVYPNPCSCLNFRQALWHLTMRPASVFMYPLVTVVPPCYGLFSKPILNPYPYSPAAAIATLESDVCPADGYPDFPLDDGTGHRYWDLNGNGSYDGGDEYLEIRFAIRNDHYHRLFWGDALADEMEAVNIRVDARYGPSAVAYDWWFYNKEVHLYTAGWSLGVDPDFLWIWHSDFYWHPGICHNTGYVNDAILDDAADHVRYANTADEALTYSYIFQDRFAEVAVAVPWWSYAGSKAVRRRYTGGTNEVPVGDGEDPYRGNYWDGIVNVPGYGCDNYWSFLNMHPRGFERGNCSDMTIRHGFSTSEIGSLNPIYATREHEWKILGLIYDTLLKRNPYDLSDIMPWLASDYEVGTYEHPIYGTWSKVNFTLRPDVTWHDGTPLTTADVYFTLVELPQILIDRGYPPPWWYPNVQNILDFQIYDAYNFEVLFDVKSIYVASWLDGQIDLGYHKWPWGTPILPKHIWKPIAETGIPDDHTADPNMIGSGPWRFQEYAGFSHVLLVANKPNSTVTTSHAGSVPITSPNGFHRYWPFYADTYEDPGRRSKVGYEENITLISDFTNLWDNTTEITTEVYINDTLTDINNTTTTQMVGFNEKAHYIDMHLMARALDFGYSEVHYQDLPGPMAVLTYHKRLYIHLAGYFVLTLNGTPILDLDWDCFWVKIDIYRYYRVFDHEWIESCTWYPLDIELSWHTIKEDIAGSTWYDDADVVVPGLAGYPYKCQLRTPDMKVDIKDIALAAKAFGSYPGHPHWSAVVDINLDYQIDIRDIAAIARQFGWVG